MKTLVPPPVLRCSAMLRATMYYLVASFIVHVSASQVPLGPGHQRYSEWKERPTDDRFTEWSLDDAPHPNTTDHLVFETVHSLLQHWPNTRMRNGHTIVPGIIPKGTLLYHGSFRNVIPPGPEWVATDPEHSMVFCLEVMGNGCWHLTLATTRPLKVVYFDGSSAAKLAYGTMDTQDLVAWGEIRPGDIYQEFVRIADLCKWGKDYGVDGFVRMEMDFEIMLCDFTAGVSVVSFLNLVPSFRFPGDMQHLGSHIFGVMHSGSWHNRFPGETRIQLDLPGLVSFYDTKLAPSLVSVRAGQERWDHRAGQNLSSEDLSAAISRLTEALTRPKRQSSGIDWATLLQVIVDRYAERLELMQYLLNSTPSDPSEILDLASKTQTQLRVMITPYALFSASPADPSNKTDLDWTIPIFKLCATTHTQSMESGLPLMTPSERFILQAIRGTSREICRVVTRMWSAGVYAGLDAYLNTKESPDIDEVTQVRDTWTEELSCLMKWLDWSVWVKCKPACGPKELCYLPTWPIGFPRGDRERRRPDPDALYSESTDAFNASLRTIITERLAEERWNAMEPGPDEWIRPQPKCIRRLEPYDF